LLTLARYTGSGLNFKKFKGQELGVDNTSFV